MLRQSTNLMILDARQRLRSLDLLFGRVSSIKRRGEPCLSERKGKL